MTRWLPHLFSLLCLAAPTLAAAVAYDLPGNMPPGCTRSGSDYTCPGGNLGYNDTVTVSSPKPATVTINGNFGTDTSQINWGGSAADLTLIVNGTLTLGYNAKITANITANAVNDAGGGNVTITGNLTANNNGNISLAYLSSVTGNVATSGSGTITTGQNGTIGGNVTGGSGTITISENGSVTGNVTGAGTVTLVQKAIVSGNVAAGSGAVNLGFQARVNGNLSTTGAVTLAQESRVGGTLTGGTGSVAVGYAATVVGALQTSSGSISFAQAAVAQACVRSTASASITLGYQSSIHSVCCGASCGNSCVANNSTYAMPPACSGTTSLLADYRMDESTAWNGTAAEVKDASGNGYHARSATASGGTPVATTASGSPAYGNTSNGSCGYGHFNRSTPAGTASHTYVQLPGGFPSLSGSFTLLAWIRSPVPAQANQRIFANDDNQNGWALSLGDAGSASLRLFNRNMNANGGVTATGSSGASNANCSGGTFCLDSAPIIAANTWYYIAALVDTTSKQVQTRIYNASGTLLASASSAYTGTWVAGSGGSSLGGESASSSEGQNSSFHFNGHIDELQVHSGLLNASAITTQLARSRACPLPGISGFAISGTGSASTCTPQTLTITARDINGNTLTSYTGTVNLGTSNNLGTWSAGASPAPAGTLVLGSNGQASYTFAAADAGIVKLRLAQNAAQNVTVTVVDSAVPSTSTTSAAINYRDNAFVWAEDLANLVVGSNVAVAGRNHPMQLTLIRKDASSNNCGVATDYTGSRDLKLWRTDNGGSWTAPSVASPALSVPTTRPAANNLALTFTAGVATFNLATTNIGKYAFNVDDDSLGYAATTLSGSSGDLTVRPFTLAVTGLTASGTANPNGSAATDGVFAKAGAPFAATVTAYRWAAGADANNDGVPDSGVTLGQVSTGGVAAGYNSAVSLTLAAGSVTPSGGAAGTLANNVVSGFSNGAGTTSTMTYSEVGSFALNTSGVVGNYLGTAGLNLDALVFNAAGNQNTRVGRFTPAGFALSNGSVTHRVDQACSVASTFTYLDEYFRLGFTLTAQNAAGGTTVNYAGAFARLDLATATKLKPAGIDGSTMLKTSNGRLGLDSTTGGWTAGVANVTLRARGLRAATPDGPFANAAFGIAAVDDDGVGMLVPDLDTDSPANGADSVKVGGAIPLRHGRLRLQNAMGAANRTLSLPLAAQYWNGTAFTTNALDSCTRISATHLSFGNLRNLTAANAAMVGSTATVTAGVGSLTLAAPGSSRATYDVAIALDSATPPADASCLKTATNWTPAKAATAGAGLTALRAAWCGSAMADPAARASWGLYRGADGVLYLRENY
jgi:MSHA biogenesis protein MshQ